MPFEAAKKIWMDGKLVDWDDAKIHILTHTLHYGCGVFEGIRAYETADGPAVFRLTDHIVRMFKSAKIYLIDIPFTLEQLVSATKETVRVNQLDSCYIRPIVYLGYGEMGLNPLPCPVNVSIAVWRWGSYLGDEGIAKSKSEQPDLILMDIIMPGTDGFKATRAIARDEATKHIPVIVCTSKKLETDRVWGMRQGAKDYIVKPVDAKDLLAKIAALG